VQEREPHLTRRTRKQQPPGDVRSLCDHTRERQSNSARDSRERRKRRNRDVREGKERLGRDEHLERGRGQPRVTSARGSREQAGSPGARGGDLAGLPAHLLRTRRRRRDGHRRAHARLADENDTLTGRC
jgi:hypothetical protein